MNLQRVTRIAQVAHEANRAYCATLGDFTQPTWEEAPEWQRTSAINGALAYLDSQGIAGPAEMHESWMAEKLADGWVYGPEKDPERKTHPCLVDYFELPEEQQAKDRLFLGVLRALL